MRDETGGRVKREEEKWEGTVDNEKGMRWKYQEKWKHNRKDAAKKWK